MSTQIGSMTWNFIDTPIIALVDFFRSVVRLASARLPQRSQIESFFLETSMSTTRSKDRSSLCSFTFADGRQCRTPRAAHPYLCAFHARKEAQALAGEAAGQDIAYHLSGSYVSACDLSSALGRLFSAVAQGQVRISRLRIAQNSLLTNLFRINTCKSVSKQSTLTTFRIN